MICIQTPGIDQAGQSEQLVTRLNFCIQKKARICRPRERRQLSGFKKVYKSSNFTLIKISQMGLNYKNTLGIGFKQLILHKNLLLKIMQIIDERLPLAGQKIVAGEITNFSQLLKFIPKTAIAKSLSLNTGRWFVNKFEDPYFFRVGELIELARLMTIEPEYLLKIMLPEIAAITDRKFTEKPKEKSEDVAADRKRAKELKAKGMKNKEIQDLMDISRMTLYRYLKEIENE